MKFKINDLYVIIIYNQKNIYILSIKYSIIDIKVIINAIIKNFLEKNYLF